MDADDATRFVRAFLDDDQLSLDESVDRLGSWRTSLLMSCLLTVLVRDRFGHAASLAQLSDYAGEQAVVHPTKLRRIVVERVLRAGAGHERGLAGLPDEEVLEATATVLRWMRPDPRTVTAGRDELIEKVVRLAAAGSPGDT